MGCANGQAFQCLMQPMHPPPKREASSFYLSPKRHQVAVSICIGEEAHDYPTVETLSQLRNGPTTTTTTTTTKISKDIQQ